MENTRSKEFRYVYAGGFSVTFNGQDAILRFGVKEGELDVLHEEVGVIMPPATMKILGILLGKTVEMIERTSGNNIPIDQSKIDNIENTLKAAEKNAVEKKNATAPTVSPQLS